MITQADYDANKDAFTWGEDFIIQLLMEIRDKLQPIYLPYPNPPNYPYTIPQPYWGGTSLTALPDTQLV